MSYKDYLDKNDKYLEASTSTRVNARMLELVIFGIISFAFGFIGGKLPPVDGVTFGLGSAVPRIRYIEFIVA